MPPKTTKKSKSGSSNKGSNDPKVEPKVEIKDTTDSEMSDDNMYDENEENEENESAQEKLEDQVDEELEAQDKLEDDDVEDDDEDEEEDEDDQCYFKYADKKGEFSDEEEEDDDDGIDDVNDTSVVILKGNDRITKPILTKYERVRLLETRTKQLSLGAKPMLKNVEGLSSSEIATLEIKNNVVPIIIERPLPGNVFEEWKITELEH